MIASAFEFHKPLAAVAALVLVLLRRVQKLEQFRILRTVFLSMRLAIAHCAYSGFALVAFTNLLVDVLRRNPFSTIWRGTVDPVIGSEFGVLFVPQVLSPRGQQLVDVL